MYASIEITRKNVNLQIRNNYKSGFQVDKLNSQEAINNQNLSFSLSVFKFVTSTIVELV